MAALGLNVHNISRPFDFYQIFDKKIQILGYTENQKHKTFGDVENLDFITYYYNDNDNIIGAVSSGLENNKKLLLLREAMTYEQYIKMEFLKEENFYNKLY